jgi:hypothetical protein
VDPFFRPPKFQDRLWLHALLFALTVVSTTFVGALHYVAFATDFGTGGAPLAASELLTPGFLLPGFWYSGTSHDSGLSRARTLFCLPLL